MSPSAKPDFVSDRPGFQTPDRFNGGLPWGLPARDIGREAALVAALERGDALRLHAEEHHFRVGFPDLLLEAGDDPLHVAGGEIVGEIDAERRDDLAGAKLYRQQPVGMLDARLRARGRRSSRGSRCALPRR
jgi:hypothetical protein